MFPFFHTNRNDRWTSKLAKYICLLVLPDIVYNTATTKPVHINLPSQIDLELTLRSLTPVNEDKHTVVIVV